MIDKKDQSIFQQVNDELYTELLFYAKRIIKNDGDAEKLVQDKIADVWLGPKRFEELENLKKYLYTSVKNACLDYKRKKQKEAAGNAEYGSMVSGETDLRQTLEMIDLIKMILAEADKLSPRNKEVFLRVCIDGETQVQVANDLGISPNTVAEYLRRAKEIIKNVLPPDIWSVIAIVLDTIFRSR